MHWWTQAIESKTWTKAMFSLLRKLLKCSTNCARFSKSDLRYSCKYFPWETLRNIPRKFKHFTKIRKQRIALTWFFKAVVKIEKLQCYIEVVRNWISLNYDQHFFLVISKKVISMRIGEIRDSKACYLHIQHGRCN